MSYCGGANIVPVILAKLAKSPAELAGNQTHLPPAHQPSSRSAFVRINPAVTLAKSVKNAAELAGIWTPLAVAYLTSPIVCLSHTPYLQ